MTKKKISTALFLQDYSIIKAHRTKRDAPVDLHGSGGNHFPKDPKKRRFYVFISVFVSARTRDEQVSAAIKRLMDINCDLDMLCTMEIEKLASILNMPGKNQKAEQLKSAAILIRDEYDGEIPRKVNALLKFNGIGEKKAFAIMNFVWQECLGISVDVHINRIANRLGWVNTTNGDKVRTLLQGLVPRKNWGEFIALLPGFGQQICKKKPLCDICLLLTE